jgi:hypothetical protein
MREEYDRTGSTETAVIRGIGRTGRLVTSAALILFLAFTALGSGPGTKLKMFATALAVDCAHYPARARLLHRLIRRWCASADAQRSPRGVSRLGSASC